VWTRQNYRRYHLQHFVRQNNSSASLCAATCRLQPNCSVYELAESADGVACTFAASYDETSFDVEPLVTSFTRKEHDCRLRGKLINNLLPHAVICGIITFCVSRRRRKMYCGHTRLCVCVSVCLSVCPRPYAQITARTRM